MLVRSLYLLCKIERDQINILNLNKSLPRSHVFNLSFGDQIQIAARSEVSLLHTHGEQIRRAKGPAHPAYLPQLSITFINFKCNTHWNDDNRISQKHSHSRGQFHKTNMPKFVIQNAKIFMAFSMFNFIKAFTPKFSQHIAKKWWCFNSWIS